MLWPAFRTQPFPERLPPPAPLPCPSFQRPAAVPFDRSIYLLHQSPCLQQRPDNALILRLFFVSKRATDAVLQPASRGQIAADGKGPCRLRHSFEILAIVDPHAARLSPLRRLIARLLNHIG